jgi:hypothetical protein
MFRRNVSPPIIRVTKIGQLGTLAVTSNRSTMRRNTLWIVCSISSSCASVASYY